MKNFLLLILCVCFFTCSKDDKENVVEKEYNVIYVVNSTTSLKNFTVYYSTPENNFNGLAEETVQGVYWSYECTIKTPPRRSIQLDLQVGAQSHNSEIKIYVDGVLMASDKCNTDSMYQCGTWYTLE